MKHLVFYESKDALGSLIKGNVDCDFIHNPPSLKDIRELESDIGTRFCNGQIAAVTGWLPIQDENDIIEPETLSVTINDTKFMPRDSVEIFDEFGSCIYVVELGTYSYRSHMHIGWYMKLDSVSKDYPDEHRVMIRPLMDLESEDIKSYNKVNE